MAKVRQQAASASSSSSIISIHSTSNGSLEISKASKHKSPGAVGLLVQIAQKDGLKGWYRVSCKIILFAE
jgi:hypothetical protein